MEELRPTNGRKSFYGKALIDHKKNYDALYSYGTEIIRKYKDNKLVAVADPTIISLTTSTHLLSFCGINKQQYVKLWNERRK